MRIKYQEPKTKHQKPFIFFVFCFLSRRLVSPKYCKGGSNILLAFLCIGGLLFTFPPWCIPGSFLSADTHIPYGDVSGTWTIEGSPYIIDGYITVPVDSTLIIEPSVFVIFSTNNGLQIEGKLLSEGTENDSIIFAVQDSSNNTGLGFYHTDITNQDSSKITYSIFEHVSVCFNKSSNILFRKSSVSKCVGWSGVFFDENSSPTLIDITISDNTTEYYGGGIYCTDSSNPSITNVTVSGNSATWGGGISCRFNSNPTLENVSIINNSTSAAGAGIFCEESSPNLNNVIILENEGSGICCTDESSPTLNNVTINNNNNGVGCFNSSPTLNNVIINENYAFESGGGIYCGNGSSLELNNVTITGNYANLWGGGIYCDLSDVAIVNSIITGNTAEGGGGGGIGCYFESNMIITNVTISGNNAISGFGGGIHTEFDSNIHLENCILWNDIPDEVLIMTGSFVSANYCDIEGGAMGTGNIDDDPLFSDDEFHLSESSPCIDAGNPDSLYYDIEDPYNSGYALYPAMGTILNDMGAYGGHGYYEPPVAVDNYELHPATAGYELNNYPNPFNPETTIRFTTEHTSLRQGYAGQAENTELIIYNIKGQCIRKFKIENVKCKMNEIVWDGTDENNQPVSSGIYFYKLKVNNTTKAVRKMLLIK